MLLHDDAACDDDDAVAVSNSMASNNMKWQHGICEWVLVGTKLAMVTFVLLLLRACAVAQAASPLSLTASVASASSFRLSVRTTTAYEALPRIAPSPTPLPSPSLWSEASPAPFRRAHRDSDGADGVITDFGSLWVLADDKGWELLDAANKTLVGGGLPTLGEVTGLLLPAVLLPVTKTWGNAWSQGESRSALGEPCLGNGKFEAPWYVDDQSGAFAFIVAAAREGSRPECAPLAFRAPRPRQDKCANPILKHDATTGDRVTQYANLTMKECCASCNNNTLVRRAVLAGLPLYVLLYLTIHPVR